MSSLSSRANGFIAPNNTRDLMMAVFTNPHSDTNPDGVAIMGVAENKLMHPEIAAYMNKHLNVTSKMLTYGDGPTGSLGLKSAVAGFINREFEPFEKLNGDGSQVSILNGVSSVIDAICFCIAEPGEGVLIARPLYVGFLGDFEERAGVKPICVEMHGTDPTSLESVKRHEDALLEAQKNGIKVKGLMLCNPHNPLGRCYTREVIEDYMRLCQDYGIHLISDEVYAKAVFANSDVPDPVPFTSILALDIKRFIDPSLVHVLYGMSKDFSSNGLRIGALISLSNPPLHAALYTCGRFFWASSLSDAIWATMLNDEEWLKAYFEEMRSRLRESYEVCVGVLREWGVVYVPANCGPFIWLSLQKFLPPNAQTVEEERKLAWKMVNGVGGTGREGVWLATGEAFMSEEPGWFRLTFAVPEEELRFGLGRLQDVLFGA